MKESKSCVKLDIISEKPSLFDSKLGGTPYIPRDGEYPVNSEGEQLDLLAQINCEDIAKLGVLDIFPKTGLLQFWIANDDMYGADFNNFTKQDNFRVVYFPCVDTTVTEEDVLAKFVEPDEDGYEEMSPLNDKKRGYKLVASVKESKYYDSGFDYPDMTEEEAEKYSGEAYNTVIGHSIGGYPYFTQYDPRENESDSEYDFQLLQIDSDMLKLDENDKKDWVVSWGDAGVANFFIKSESLRNLDFSDVFYTWDCG